MSRLIDVERFSDDAFITSRTPGYISSHSELLRNIPTVNPVKHAHWITIGGGWDTQRCSNCSHECEFSIMNYCPECGAKMDEVTKNDEKSRDY